MAMNSLYAGSHIMVVDDEIATEEGGLTVRRQRSPEEVNRITQLVKEACPGLMVDGEMQADTAVVREIIEGTYPFSSLKGGANVLIFPDLESANIAYKLCSELGGAEAVAEPPTVKHKPAPVTVRVFALPTCAACRVGLQYSQNE